MIGKICKQKYFFCKSTKLASQYNSLIIRYVFRQEPRIYPHNSLIISNGYEDFFAKRIKKRIKTAKVPDKIVVF